MTLTSKYKITTFTRWTQSDQKQVNQSIMNILPLPAPQVGSKPVPIPVPAGPADKDVMHRLVEKMTEQLKDAGVSELVTTSEEKQMVKAVAAGNLEKVKDLLRQNPKLVKRIHVSINELFNSDNYV